jgi:superfamily II DNA or RNA helicase
VKLGSTIRIGYGELTSRELERLRRSLSFATPDGKVVTCYRDVISGGYIRIPRGAQYLLNGYAVQDVRSLPVMPRMKFTVKLDDIEKSERFVGQRAAVDAMFEHEQGQIIRPPGTGKTQIALAFAAECETRTLVLVHTKDILNQWVDYAREAIPEIPIGIIQGNRVQIGHLTIATVQTIKKFVEPSLGKKKFWRHFGCVIVDEGHHGAARTWEIILNSCPAYYRFSFTASPTRADGLHPALNFLYGPVIHRQKFSSPVDLKVVPVKTKFYYPYRGTWDWTNMVTALVQDDTRNERIAKIANREAEAGNSILVLSRRIEHLERIADKLEGHCEILTGSRKDADRRKILTDFRAGRIPTLLATQLADEALDVPRLNRIILVHPGKHEGRIIQQIGRAIREHPKKKDAVIYDVVDPRVGVLRRQWDKRKRTYRQNRIAIRKRGKVKWQ